MSSLFVGALVGAHPAAAAGPNAIISSAGCQTTELAADDDGSSASEALPFTVNFFGNSFNSLWVNNNGNVTFDEPLGTYTPFPLLTTNHVIIAPFFGDVDTRAGNTTHYGAIAAGDGQIGGDQAFCVDWLNVGYYAEHTDKTNSFQLVLIDRSDTGPGNFDIEFNYDQIQWETGDASGGSGGLGGSSARVGYSNGTSASYELPGSAVNGSFLDTNTTSGLIYNNINSALQQGRYVFPVRNGAATGHAISGHVWANAPGTPVAGAFVSACPVPFDTPCRLASSGADGSYQLTNLPDSTSGGGAVDHDWNLIVNPPGGSGLSSGTLGPIPVAGSDAINQDVVLTGPTPMPSGASITTASGTQTSGVPTTYWGNPMTVSLPGCVGATSASATFAMPDGYTQTVSLTEGPAGTYSGTFAAPYPHHGAATITWAITCASDNSSGHFDLYIDPSGTVVDSLGNPVQGATVTLFRSDDLGGPFVAVPDGSAIMSPANQNNPDTTDAAGNFGWDVVAGYYQVQASKSGCHAPGNAAQTTVVTPAFQVPPPATDLSLTLDCSGGAGPTITSVGHARRGQDSASHLVQIRGTGFEPGAIASFSGAGITATSSTVVRSTLLTVAVAVSPTAPLGARDVTVTNPDTSAITCTGCLTVSAAPAIASVSGGPVAAGSNGVQLPVSGSNFEVGITAQTWVPGVTIVSVNRVDSHHVIVTVDVAADAPAGHGALWVYNPDGGRASKNGAIDIS